MVSRMEGELARTWIGKMSSYETIQAPRTVQAVQVPFDFVVVQDGDAPITGELHCIAGSWLVKSPQGTLYPVPDAVFQKWYQEVVEYEQIAGVRRL